MGSFVCCQLAANPHVSAASAETAHLRTPQATKMAEYNDYIERMRREEYPMLKDELYLDHAGTTLYCKRQLDQFRDCMIFGLYGNPHSASPSSHASTQAIDRIRLQALEYLGANPAEFDLVFTSNATAAIKLVADAFREHHAGFQYAYHVDSHTSLIGVREVATGQLCWSTEDQLDCWLGQTQSLHRSVLNLFAYPAQSNMNGRRLPLEWIQKARLVSDHNTYCLLDAAAYASTSPLRLSSLASAPDFTVVSFSKIFGFPNLGALIVKKTAAHVFEGRKYFGGGTVDMVVCMKEQWHIKKTDCLHDQLEDGTLPMHNIFALQSAMESHQGLFGSLEQIAKHTECLADRLYSGLLRLKHANQKPVCAIYKAAQSTYGDGSTQGPVVAFNIRDRRGVWVNTTEVEKLASIRNIHLRTGGLCNPGGIATHLSLAPWEMRENFSAGFRCGGETSVFNGKPTGMIRVSLGAMSTLSDVYQFLAFMEEFFVQATPLSISQPTLPSRVISAPRLYIESLTVYPIKSCSGWQVPLNMPWDVHREGLAWDREWCVVKQPSGTALSQKSNPRMALIRPELDFRSGVLRIRLAGSTAQVTVPLSHDPKPFSDATATATAACQTSAASVCGDSIRARVYTSRSLADFFTTALGFPCALARFPPPSRNRHLSPDAGSIRRSKLNPGSQSPNNHRRQPSNAVETGHPLRLSNESPILTISRSSLNRLNESIKAAGGQAAHPAVFRANIVLAEDPATRPGTERAWAEDTWAGMRVGGTQEGDGPGNGVGDVVEGSATAATEAAGGGGGGGGGGRGAGVEFDFLGGCRRCQVVCVNPESGERNQEPFVTLAKTRRFEGRVLFGVHTALAREQGAGAAGLASIKVGDSVAPFAKELA